MELAAQLVEDRPPIAREGGLRTFDHPADGFVRYQQVSLTITGLRFPSSNTSGLSPAILKSSLNAQTRAVTGFSINILNAASSSAPSAPSTTRWSHESVTVI